MNHLAVEKLTKSYADKLLFKDISFGLSQGDKVALVGANGAGKSTLLKILMGFETAESGNFTFAKSARVGFLPQEPDVQNHDHIMEYVLAGEDEITQTVRAYYQALAQNDSSQLEASLVDKMTALNAWNFEATAQQVLSKLGITQLNQPVNILSGGQQKRVALARLLLQKPDIVLLDEPTNHLDLQAIEWLEDYLSKLKITLLLVTHDRYFLQAVTNNILELEDGNLYRYSGNYTDYLKKRVERHQVQNEQAGKARNLLRKEMDWLNRQPKARTSKARHRLEAIDGLRKEAANVKLTTALSINLAGKRLGKKILEVNQLSKKFKEQPIVSNFSYTFKRGDRIGLVGNNGVGKSTFLNLVTGQLVPDTGTVTKGETVTFGYYHQSGINFNQGQRVIDTIKEVAEVITLKDKTVVTASQLLTMFHFNPKKQYDYIKNLSGGEKRRLQLLKVLMANPNFLILDEPTNDLDLETLNTLEDYLEKFAGCLLIVSHDRYFMDRLVEHIFWFKGQGDIQNFPGNYTEFRSAKPTPGKPNQNPTKTNIKIKTAPKKLSFGQQRELVQIEEDLEKLSIEKNTLTQQLENETDFEKLTIQGNRLSEIETKINILEDRWLTLNEDL